MLEPRDYQQRIIEQALAAVDEGHRSILIESPTGSGKTIMAHLIAQALHRRYGWRSGWTAMRRHLLHQAEADNQRLIGFEPIRYFSLFEQNPPTDFEVLIEDEGHHAASDSSASVYAKVKPKLHLATTATPFRTDQLALCFSKVIRDAGLPQLIEAGYLSPYHQYIFDGPWTPDQLARLYLEQRRRWGQSVGYFLSLDECFRCARLLREGGVRCEVVHGHSEQDRQIDAFNRGEVDVLLNVQVLTEGFNSPALKTVFARPASKGPTIQMVGRALRRHRDKPHAQVVQNTASVWPFTRIADPAAKFRYTEGRWPILQDRTPRLHAAHGNTLSAMASLDVALPRYLKRKRRRR
ncbi:DEAD/DEAH box helicase [Phycisphaerales bacterium AB-hyl4]|uniref:DEAD/DEAH box helicase n=1 Tax=Natronomicrosphaera hydrolytica TaxID=3242702 RepID=A0ABV4U6Z3_9BACT